MVTRIKWAWISHVLQNEIGGNQERLLEAVVEQLVGGVGGYRRRGLQRPGVKHGTKNSRTLPRTFLSDNSSIVVAIWSGVKLLSRPRRYAAKPAT